MDPVLDEKTCQELLELIDDLQLPEWPLERKITRKQAKTRIANWLDLDPEDPKLLEKALEKINQILTRELKIESVPKNLDELVKEYEEHQEKLEEQRKAFLKRTYPTLSEQIRNALQTKYAHDLLEQLKESEKQLAEEERILTQNPKRAERVSQEIADGLAPNLPQTARIEALSEEEYREVLKLAQPKIKQILERAGVTQSEKVAQIFIDQAVKKDLPLAQEVAATPRSYKKEIPPLPRKEISPEKLVLPKGIADKEAAETKGVAYLLIYTTLQPRVAGTYIKRLPYIIPARIIKSVAPEAIPEWKELIAGRFVEDYDATIKKYLALGLPEDHPIVKSLKTRKARLLESQKIRVVRRDGTYYYRDKLAARILKGDYGFAKRTDQYQYAVFGKEKGVYLQSSPAPDWAAKRGYSWRLRQGLNRVGQASRMYEKITVGLGRRVIRLTLPSKVVEKITFGRFKSFGEIRTVIYRKTVGRAVSYVGRRLAKTAIGKAVKEGFKKAVTWLATRAGVQTAVAAAGITAAGPTAGVSLLIAAAVNLAIEVGGKILGKVWDTIKSIIRDPGKALALITGGIALAIVLPTSLVIVAVFPIVLGALGLASWGAASAGAIAGGFAANVVAFFAAVATLPITLPIAMFIVGLLTTLAVITTFIVFTTAGAFILPVGPTEIIPDVPPPPAPPDIPPPAGLTFRWPVDSPYTCSSNYGYRELIISGRKTCDYHEGIDIPASTGARVYSTAEGEVTSLGYNSGYGTYVVVKHNGLYSFYAHLLATATYVGAKVDKSSVIGYVDNTGWSTGPHLHFAFSSCGSVPSCFNNGSLTPDPCNYVTKANPACPERCGYRNKATGCPSL